MFWTLEFLGCVAVKCSVLNVISSLTSSSEPLCSRIIFSWLHLFPATSGRLIILFDVSYWIFCCLHLWTWQSSFPEAPQPVNVPWSQASRKIQVLTMHSFSQWCLTAALWILKHETGTILAAHLSLKNDSYQNLCAAWLYVSLTQASYLKRGRLSWNSASVRSR